MPSGISFRERLRRLLSTASLRLALTFSLIFSLGAILLVAGIDYGLFRFAEAEVRADLDHQMQIMTDDATRLGGPGLVAMLEAQARNREARRYLFLIITSDGRSFSNGLARSSVNTEGFRRNLPNKPRAARWPDQRPNMLVLSHMAPDGTLLAIGRDTKHLDELRHGIRTFALWSGLGMIVCAVLAGFGLGYQFLRRLSGVNRSVEHIISGNTAERLPLIGFGREFDDLAHNLNRMLDRQQAVLEALKNVSEGIAHDLRTPLGRLRNRLEELETVDEREKQAGVELAMQELDEITGLFDSLLALSQLERGQQASQITLLDAGRLVESIGEIYQPSVEDAGGMLKMPVKGACAEPIMILGDGSLLTQAISNLVENAIVHGDAPPQVTLDVRKNGDRVIFSVADNGPGIPAQEREKVLRRFYRMDSSRSRPGSGLGLAMCAAVANWHDGSLVLEDNEPGLRVELILPTA